MAWPGLVLCNAMAQGSEHTPQRCFNLDLEEVRTSVPQRLEAAGSRSVLHSSTLVPRPARPPRPARRCVTALLGLGCLSSIFCPVPGSVPITARQGCAAHPALYKGTPDQSTFSPRTDRTDRGAVEPGMGGGPVPCRPPSQSCSVLLSMTAATLSCNGDSTDIFDLAAHPHPPDTCLSSSDISRTNNSYQACNT